MSKLEIGLISPGDMGQAVGMRLAEQGHTVCVALDGRSARTRKLSAAAGFVDCGSIASLVDRCDVVLSIIDPGRAGEVARQVADAVRAGVRQPLFADCNALAPATKRDLAKLLNDAGAAFVDGGIIGPPPRGTGAIRLYVSGPEAGRFEALRTPQIDVRVISTHIGDAAAVKMCYGGVTKGLVALGAELLIAAEHHGVTQQLADELALSQPAVVQWLMASLPAMPAKAYRWVPETNEIAATFAATGLTPRMMEGSADFYAAVAATALGRESPEVAREAARSGADVIRALAAALEQTPAR